MATLPSTLILYLWAVFVWQWKNRIYLSETFLKWQRRSKVPPNARCVPSYDETDGFRVEVFHVLRTGRRRVSELHCDWRRNMGFPPHSWKFDDDDEVQEEVMTWFKELAADFYDSGMQKLVPRLNMFGQCRRLCWKINLCTGNSFTVSLL
jgi:hypothetical protein